MSQVVKRMVGYGAGAAAAAVLVWAGFVRSTPPDLMTLLSSIDTQLRLAHAIPAADNQGRPLSARRQMLADVGGLIEVAATLEPQLACIEEYRGFLAMLQGRHRDAAACYRRARGMQECSPEMRDTLVFNEARMLKAAGEPAAALQVFDQHGPTMQAAWRPQRDVECMELLVTMGRTQDAEQRLGGVVAAAAEAPMASVRAGQLLEQAGRPASAERAYLAAAAVSGIGTYRLAVLKLGAGETDRSMELLERAAAAAPAEVRELVRQDRDAWQALAVDARVQRLLEPGEAAGPSR